jgi:hypothetical protein
MCLPCSCVATSAELTHRERHLQHLFYCCVKSQLTWCVPLLPVYGPLTSNGCFSASTVLALSKYATILKIHGTIQRKAFYVSTNECAICSCRFEIISTAKKNCLLNDMLGDICIFQLTEKKSESANGCGIMHISYILLSLFRNNRIMH